MGQPESNSRPVDGREEMPAGGVQLELFGAFRLRQAGQPVAGFEHARLQQALAYLVLQRAAPISRQQLAFLFWPDTTDQQALKNLRTLLSRLRQALPEADRFLEITVQTIQWRPEAPFSLDVAEFEAALGRAATAKAAGDPSEAAEALDEAVNIYTGDLLPDCYEDWILARREQYHQACSEALEGLTRWLEERREYSRALPYARRLLEHDPLSEAAYHGLIRLHLALGERTEALRLCRACDSMLEVEFGIQPAHPTRALYEGLFEPGDQSALAAVERAAGKGATSLALVGREAEWARLIAAWRSAAVGHPQMVLLSGEAGIGKTRLAEELCGWVARQGAAVAAAHCYPTAGEAVAYAPVAEWLHSRALRSRLASLEDVWAGEVARIYPALLADRPQLKSPGPLVEAWQRTRLFEALANAVLGDGERTPMLLFLDDLQWCDQETLDWLGYLLRFAARAPVLVVATVRKFEINRVHPLMAFWLALTRSGLLSEISLAPLDAAETGLLAANLAGRALEAGEALRIYQNTEGNPLFVVEVMRAGRLEPASLALASSAASLPPKVRAVIQWRLGQVSAEGQGLAQLAAVVGRRFRFELLVQASGQGEEAVTAGLDELWQRGLVRSQGGTVYDFSHDGIRAVAYDDLSPQRRRAIHLRVARALEELHATELEAVSGQIANHYEQAGQYQAAVRYYRQAAAAAESVYANAVAARLYQHLLESELSTELPALERCGVRLALARVWRGTGQWAKAEEMNRKALAEAEALGDLRLAAQARRGLADVLRLLGYYEAALIWLAEAEQGFQAVGEWRGVVETLWIVGEIHWLRGDHPKALAALERQLAIATEMNDPQGICQALEATGMVLWSEGDWERAAETSLRSILIAGPLEYKPVLVRASITLGNIRAGEGWFGEAVYWYLRAGALAREIDDRQALSWATSNIAQILARRGEYELARAGYGRSLRTAWETGDRLTACLNVAGLAGVQERLGKPDEAEQLYRQAIDLARRLNIPSYLSGMLVGLARFLLEQGRAPEAGRILEEASDQISSVIGERLAGEDIRFEARLLGIRLRYELGELSRAEAEAELRSLQRDERLPLRQAALADGLWRLAKEDDAARSAAARLYQAAHAETGAAECRRRYWELTGELLPDPPPLPGVSDLIPDQQEDLVALLAGLDAMFE